MDKGKHTNTHAQPHTYPHSQVDTQTNTHTHKDVFGDICYNHIHLQDHDLVLGSLPHFPAILLEELLAHVDLVCLSVLCQTQLAKLFTERQAGTQQMRISENFLIFQTL